MNQVGGNDQLVFDGSSFAMDASGRMIASATSLSEDWFWSTSTRASASDMQNLHETNVKPCTGIGPGNT